MTCLHPHDCRHKPKRVRADRPVCKSCARSAVLASEAARKLCAENMTRGRIEKAARRDPFERTLVAMMGAQEASRIMAAHREARS